MSVQALATGSPPAPAERRRAKGTGTLVPRGERRWLIRIDFGRDALTGKRRRVNRTFSGSKTAAQKKMNELLLERDQGSGIEPSSVTLAEWLPQWLERHAAEGRISSRVHTRYQGIIAQHLVPSMGHIKLRDLRSSHIAEMKTRWLSRDARSTARRPLSASTACKHLIVMHQALGEAVHLNLLPRNVGDAVSKPSLVRQAEQRALNQDEILQLLETVKGTRFNLPVRFTLSTGLRQAEMLDLKWEHIDLEARLVNVPGTKTANSRRTVEISAAIVSLLQEHRQQQRERRLRLGAGWQEHGLVFPSSYGGPWNRRIFYRDYKTQVDRSGLSDTTTVTWHVLRHTAATQWIKHGADIFSVSRRLGHASAAFTMDAYAHLLQGQQRAAAEALDYLLA